MTVIPDKPLWTLIDADGAQRTISPAYARARRELTARRTAWPAFSQLIIAASPQRVAAAMPAALEQLDQLDDSAPALRYAISGVLTLVAEPGEDMGLRCLGPALADLWMEVLGVDGALVCQDAEGTLQLTMYAAGAPTLSWHDPLIQGLGAACTHLPDGRCTEEDSRHYALRALALDEDTAELDRYAFIELMLQQLGLPRLCPDLIGLTSHPL